MHGILVACFSLYPLSFVLCHVDFSVLSDVDFNVKHLHTSGGGGGFLELCTFPERWLLYVQWRTLHFTFPQLQG